MNIIYWDIENTPHNRDWLWIHMLDPTVEVVISKNKAAQPPILFKKFKVVSKIHNFKKPAKDKADDILVKDFELRLLLDESIENVYIITKDKALKEKFREAKDKYSKEVNLKFTLEHNFKNFDTTDVPKVIKTKKILQRNIKSTKFTSYKKVASIKNLRLKEIQSDINLVCNLRKSLKELGVKTK